jgi:aquaporin Z
VIDSSMARRYMAELVGTAVLVFFGAGMATVSFGFRAFGSSVAAGILLTGLVFGLVLTGLIAVIGPISGSHVNPAVTLGAYLAKRISLLDLAGYWIAQMIGGLLGALMLLWVMHTSPFYSRAHIGLGANGYGHLSLLHASGGGAFLIEIIITAVFVLVVLSATRQEASAPVAGLIIGFVLALANIMGIAVDGASVNPARSFGPAVVVGGAALSQLWLFLIAPLVGAVLGAGAFMLFHPVLDSTAVSGKGDLPAEHTLTLSAADEAEVQAASEGPSAVRRAQTGVAPGTAGQPGGAPAAQPGRAPAAQPGRAPAGQPGGQPPGAGQPGRGAAQSPGAAPGTGTGSASGGAAPATGPAEWLRRLGWQRPSGPGGSGGSAGGGSGGSPGGGSPGGGSGGSTGRTTGPSGGSPGGGPPGGSGSGNRPDDKRQ